MLIFCKTSNLNIDYKLKECLLIASVCNEHDVIHVERLRLDILIIENQMNITEEYFLCREVM